MGLGIIPLEHENRRLREENGRLNIVLASLADCVVLMTAGIPTLIKGSLNCLQKKSRYLLVFRHGATEANVEKRYAGAASDLDLCGAGREQLERTKEYLQTFAENCSPAIREKILFPKKIYLSPMKRALQTAQILYPQAEQCLVEDFREMDFGSYWFESGTPSFLVKTIQNQPLFLASLVNGRKATEDQFKNYDPDSKNMLPVVYQSGYLTIKGFEKERRKFLLDFPYTSARFRNKSGF